MSHTSKLTEGDLIQFTGTTQFFKHFSGLRYTDGVQFMAKKGEAYWLIDAIASWQISPEVKNDEMLKSIQFWTLCVHEDQSAILICERDTNDEAFRQEISYTDFPLRSIKLYVQGDVLMLPSEY